MITLHHVPQSRSMRVLWLLNELDVPFAVRVHPFDKSLRTPEYLSLSPAGRVPALEIDGERMFESLAIMQYLCERFLEAGLGCGVNDPDRMAFLTWLHFSETVSQHAAALTQQHILLRVYVGFVMGDIDNPNHHDVIELFLAIVVSLICTVLKFNR